MFYSVGMGLVTNLKFVAQMITGIGVEDCEHVDQISEVEPPSTTDCADCKAAGADWVHVRMCMTCGYVGCCDSSKLAHMRAHAQAMDHAIARSIEGNESWLWCYPHERLVRRKL